ncbi:MAG: hypothetical protein D4R38_01820 [Dehalococcoidia bacterium]|nr:MAG: hypothetical protein D4R38_01820 [Dehalococcoidia bacterium]
MYKSFETINEFVKDITGFSITEETIPSRLRGLKAFENAYNTIREINKGNRKPFSKEFIRDVYPLLEVSMQWQILKGRNELTQEFTEKCKKRVVQKQSSYYGTIFEIDVVTRCLLAGWQLLLVEDNSAPEKQIDFIFSCGDDIVGVECLSKRYSEGSLSIDKLNKDIKEKGKKFKEEYMDRLITRLGKPLDKRALIIDITTSTYSQPSILKELEKTRLSSNLDMVIYTWREDVAEGENHSLRVKYNAYGNSDREYFSATFAAEFHVNNGEPVFFIRKYVEPEPIWGQFGPEESVKDCYQ